MEGFFRFPLHFPLERRKKQKKEVIFFCSFSEIKSVSEEMEQIGILKAFLSDCRCRAMPGIDGEGIGQGQEIFPDTGHQCIGIASREVRASDGEAEKRVPCKDRIHALKKVGNSPWRMTGAGEAFQLRKSGWPPRWTVC